MLGAYPCLSCPNIVGIIRPILLVSEEIVDHVEGENSTYMFCNGGDSLPANHMWPLVTILLLNLGTLVLILPSLGLLARLEDWWLS